MAGKGGARPGAGAKKGQYRVKIDELRIALEKGLGISFPEMLAATQAKLFNDFNNNRNVKEYLLFTENMSKRLLEMPVQEIQMSNPNEDLTKEELEARVAAIVATGKSTEEQEEEQQESEE